MGRSLAWHVKDLHGMFNLQHVFSWFINCWCFLSFFLYFYGLVFINLWNQYHKLTNTATYHSLCTAAAAPHPPPLMYKIWEILLRWGSGRTQTTYQCSYKINNIHFISVIQGISGATVLLLLKPEPFRIFKDQPAHCKYLHKSSEGPRKSSSTGLRFYWKKRVFLLVGQTLR